MSSATTLNLAGAYIYSRRSRSYRRRRGSKTKSPREGPDGTHRGGSGVDAAVGRYETVTVAVAALPLPPSTDVIGVVVVVLMPVLVAVTFTVRIQVAPGVRVAPLRLIEVPPGAAV